MASAWLNEFRARLGLGPDEKNGHLLAARGRVNDGGSGVAYFRDVLHLIPLPPRSCGADHVRSFLASVSDWSDYLGAAYHACADAVERERYGHGPPRGVHAALDNILWELYSRLGVRFKGIAIRPEAFTDAAREWSQEDRAKAGRAVKRARDSMSNVVIPEMRKWLPPGDGRGFPLRADSLRECQLALETGEERTVVRARVGRRGWVTTPKAGDVIERVLGFAMGADARRPAFRTGALLHPDAGRFREWFRRMFEVEGNPDPLPCQNGEYSFEWRVRRGGPSRRHRERRLGAFIEDVRDASERPE